MENIYLILVIVLFALAVSDLIVGVSNDAVNFLNSAIGAKVASFRTIMIIAGIGIVVGATFSSGMMEVARKGIFHPDMFSFHEIIIIFLAVMLTDVILLDLFNTFGFPTSTTVSIVFELLGASVAVASYKIAGIADQSAVDLALYINSDKALAIISGILLSVVIAFTIGSLIQYFSRLIFSFNYKKRFRYFGSLYGGSAIAAITYFMLIKGSKGSSFLTPETVSFISENTLTILAGSLLGWTILLQLLQSLFKVSILKIVVLAGTFALAMAFAGNDLVNFIGVPLAGYESYKAFIASGANDPNLFMMDILREPIRTKTGFLIGAGLVMVLTLWTSKKARSVVDTTLDLSRQDEGLERFQSSPASRFIVRAAMSLSDNMKKITPNSTLRYIDRQFHRPAEIIHYEHDNHISFDMIRASVNLVVASILIAFGTSLKLPLSTTYVTFMVAMGTSLADRAWGRESAVYRITGVLSVVGGWFLTALVAFTAAFATASLIYWGELFAIIILIAVAAFIIIRTHIIHKRISSSRAADKAAYEAESNALDQLIEKTTEKINDVLTNSAEIVSSTIKALSEEDLRTLRKLQSDVKKLRENTKRQKVNLNHTIQLFRDDAVDAGPHYVQVVDYLREIVHCVAYIAEPAYDHVNNMHKTMTDEQHEELSDVSARIKQLMADIITEIDDKQFNRYDKIIKDQNELLDEVKSLRKKHVKRIKNEKASTKASVLYFDILSETKNLLLFSVNLMKATRDMVTASYD